MIYFDMAGAGLLDLLLFGLTAALFIFPGLLIVIVLYKGRSWEEIMLRGPGVGFAAAIFLAFALSYFHLALFWCAWALLTVVVLLMVGRLPIRRPSWASLDIYNWWLIVLLGVVLAVRLAATLWEVLPLGWDSSFHLILAKKILITHGMISDWLPFEDARLNYPTGSHVLLAEFSLLNGLPLHTVFKFLFPLFGAITTAQMFFFALRVSAQRDTALFSAMAYGLLAVFGSIDYYRWGGLPNLIGMSFFLECLIILTERKPAFRESAFFGLTFTAIFFTHHHVMITAGLTFTAALAVNLFRLDDRRRATVILQGLLVSLAIGSFYIVPYVLKASTLGGTSILTFQEPFCTPRCMYYSVGPIFAEMAGLGLVAYVIQAVLRNRESRFDPLLLVTIGALAVLYILFEYVFRAASLWFFGKGYAAFTPSRFLTDLVYFLAVFAGYSAGFVRRRLPLPATAGVSLVALTLLAVAHSDEAPFYAKHDPDVTADRYAALDWIANHTPSNTIVMDDGKFTPYISWRRSFYTPMPVSEPRLSSHRLSSEEIAKLRLSGDQSGEARAWELISVGPVASAQPGDEVVHQSNLEAVIVKKRPE